MKALSDYFYPIFIKLAVKINGLKTGQITVVIELCLPDGTIMTVWLSCSTVIKWSPSEMSIAFLFQGKYKP